MFRDSGVLKVSPGVLPGFFPRVSAESFSGISTRVPLRVSSVVFPNFPAGVRFLRDYSQNSPQNPYRNLTWDSGFLLKFFLKLLLELFRGFFPGVFLGISSEISYIITGK